MNFSKVISHAILEKNSVPQNFQHTLQSEKTTTQSNTNTHTHTHTHTGYTA
jgi:hypothetical protein